MRISLFSCLIFYLPIHILEEEKKLYATDLVDETGIGADLNGQDPARVTFTPTIQYLPLGSSGVVHCYIQAHPPLQYVTWVKNKRLFEPYQTTDIIILNNGSLLFTTVNENHQGSYTCTPYNHQGTEGSSGPMEVLVRKPPAFTIKPEAIYLVKVGDTVEMHCEAQEGENTQKPTMQWRRSDGNPLPKKRVEIVGGNITIENLTHSDIGSYQCLASNEVGKILASTELVIEGNLLLDPYNLTGTALESAVTLSWVSGSSQQTYRIWYREAGAVDWLTKLVTPSGSTQMRINCLAPGTSYEFQLVGKNVLEDVMLSNIITVRTLSKESLTDDGN